MINGMKNTKLLILLLAIIATVKKDFEEGTIDVKVWKDIGMTFRDSLGRITFIDDSGFDPFFVFNADNDKTVIALSEKDNFEDSKASIEKKWKEDWKCFARDEMIDSPNVNSSFKGLGLDEDIVRKIYFINALKWLPEICI